MHIFAALITKHITTMAREARKVAETGVYHTIIRGVNKQQIFECSNDYQRFIEILQRVCGVDNSPKPGTPIPYDEPAGFVEIPVRQCYIYAWCLMSNHVHLLLKTVDNVEIGEAMKSITSSYALYYNKKYERVGHLFQERFLSQPVDNWDYFVTLLRYIHQNPIKGFVIEKLSEYRWCSWTEYIGKEDFGITSKKTVLNRLTIEELARLIDEEIPENETDKVIDYEFKKTRTLTRDEEAWKVIKELTGASNLAEFQQIERPKQKYYLFELTERGIGPRTLSRLTGVQYTIIVRATSAAKDKYHYQSKTVHDVSPEDELFFTYCDAEDFVSNPTY